jgi:hypothetical protein
MEKKASLLLFVIIEVAHIFKNRENNGGMANFSKLLRKENDISYVRNKNKIRKEHARGKKNKVHVEKDIFLGREKVFGSRCGYK